MKRGPGRPRNVKTGNRGRPCKKYKWCQPTQTLKSNPMMRQQVLSSI